jgi:hypothetical protein
MASGPDSGLSWTQGDGTLLPRQRFRSCGPPRTLLRDDCADSKVSTPTYLAAANRRAVGASRSGQRLGFFAFPERLRR